MKLFSSLKLSAINWDKKGAVSDAELPVSDLIGTLAEEKVKTELRFYKGEPGLNQPTVDRIGFSISAVLKTSSYKMSSLFYLVKDVEGNVDIFGSKVNPSNLKKGFSVKTKVGKVSLGDNTISLKDGRGDDMEVEFNSKDYKEILSLLQMDCDKLKSWMGIK